MGAILVAGTSSDAGKSFLVAGLLRALARRGVSASPFKGQNMSLNAFVVSGGGAEIARVQATQAQAARIEPVVEHNPVLLKPTADAASQVVVMGRARWVLKAEEYQNRRVALLGEVLEAFDSLVARHEIVVAEGAGALGEVNFRQGDIANFAVVDHRDVPIVIVGDVDRGGALAALAGTHLFLDERSRGRVKGFVLNKFRGRMDLLRPGIEELEARTGVPVLGVVPLVEGLLWEVEDSATLQASVGTLLSSTLGFLGGGDRSARPRAAGRANDYRAAWGNPVKKFGRIEEDASTFSKALGPSSASTSLHPHFDEVLTVAVVRLPRIANFSDFLPLAVEPGVSLRFTARPADIGAADLVVVPGSKSTVSDLAWLRGLGIDEVLVGRAERGKPTVGICGGFQMLGVEIRDGVESSTLACEGLGLLPMATTFAKHKLLCRTYAHRSALGVSVTGFEMRYGRQLRVRPRGRPRVLWEEARPLFEISSRETGIEGGMVPQALGEDREFEGCVAGPTMGTSLHGIFEDDSFRRAVLRWAADRCGKRFCWPEVSFGEVRDRALEAMADLVEEALDLDALMELADEATKGFS